MSRFVLALDQGTTSCRAMLFDRTGASVARAQREFTQHYPASGWVEHDAVEIWQVQRTVLREALAEARATARDLVAIGITNQRESTLLWDRVSGEPVSRVIVWQDRRTAARCEALRAGGHEDAVRERTGLLLDPYFSATKLEWLLDHVAGARARAERGELAFGTLDSWLVWQLTGGAAHLTDTTNASRTLLYDLERGGWAPELLELFRIPDACLPRVVPSSQGADMAPSADLDGVAVPITGIAGDQQAALYGQAAFNRGMVKNTYGTGCFLLMNTGSERPRSRHRLLATRACGRSTLQYALEGAVFTGGAVVQWLRDGLGFIDSAHDVEALAASVPDSGDVYLVPAFTGLGSPHWDAHARGAMVGLSRGTTRAHIARAALEAIAFQSVELVRAMEQDAGTTLTELRVDGGATANDLLMQLQADLLGTPVVRPRVTETTALGAAYLAGIGAGFWSSEAEVAALWRVDRVFEPALPAAEAAARLARWSRAVERARNWTRD